MCAQSQGLAGPALTTDSLAGEVRGALEGGVGEEGFVLVPEIDRAGVAIG